MKKRFVKSLKFSYLLQFYSNTIISIVFMLTKLKLAFKYIPVTDILGLFSTLTLIIKNW
jgi:hypothetical protein